MLMNKRRSGTPCYGECYHRRGGGGGGGVSAFTRQLQSVHLLLEGPPAIPTGRMVNLRELGLA